MKTLRQKLIRAGLTGIISLIVCIIAVLIANTERFGLWKIPDWIANRTVTFTTEKGEQRTVTMDRKTLNGYTQYCEEGSSAFNELLLADLEKGKKPNITRIHDIGIFYRLNNVPVFKTLKPETWRQRLLTGLAITAIGVWFSAIMTDKRLKALCITIAFFSSWCLLIAAANVNQFWLSAGLMVVLSVSGAAYILHDIKKTTAPEAPGRMVRLTGSLFLASGLFTFSGWFFPLGYAQPLRNSGLVAGFIDIRFAVTAVFALSFILSGIVSALISVWSDEKTWTRVKQPIKLVDRLRIKEGQVKQTMRHALAPIVLIVLVVVQTQRWVAEVSRYLSRMIWTLLRKQLYASFLVLARFVIGCWIIATSCHWFGIHVKAYLNNPGAFWDSPEVWANAGLVVGCIMLCLLGLHILTYKKHSHFTQRDVPGKLVPVLFAALITGVAVWVAHLFGIAANVSGFQHVGLYTVALPSLLAIITIVGLIADNVPRREPPAGVAAQS